MKKVLIVSPNWPPVTYPDMHRVRMALPYMKEMNWEPLVLHTDPNEQGGFKEPALVNTLPGKTREWQAKAVPRLWTVLFGITHVGWRSLWSLYVTGCKIIEQEKPDLAFFSTTMFPVMILGPLWKKKYALRYVLDFQDPWVPGVGTGIIPVPGLKNEVSRLIDRRLERFALQGPSQLISVSLAYIDALIGRYPHLRRERTTVLPFGAPEADFAYVEANGITQSVYSSKDGRRHWVYAGRGGSDLHLGLRAFFLALSKTRRKAPAKWKDLSLHFIGTHYASTIHDVRPIEQLAKDCGVGDLVQEQSVRIGYLESLRCLLDADALIVMGSTDAGYTASKIYPYILAKKPLLAVFHEQSSVCQVLRGTHAGELVTFADRENAETLAVKISKQWFEKVPKPKTDWNAFEPYTAHLMTRRMCEAFDQALEDPSL